jgi:hypothetical protein
MYRFARDEGIDLEDLRARLRKMTDEDLVRFGKATRFMCRDTIAATGIRDSVGGSTSGMATAVSQGVSHILSGDTTLKSEPKLRWTPRLFNRFTCIATAPKVSDVHPDLLKCFSLSLSVAPYRNSELEAIAVELARENGLLLGDGAAHLLIGVSEGNPDAIEQLVRRFSRLGKTDVTAEEAAQVLAAFGLNPLTITSTGVAANANDLDKLTGVEFEKLITALLQRMGFHAEMSRATGDCQP